MCKIALLTFNSVEMQHKHSSNFTKHIKTDERWLVGKQDDDRSTQVPKKDDKWYDQ